MNKIIDAWRDIKTDDIFLIDELKNDDDSLMDRFINKIEFGSSGIEGKLGAGFDRMNVHSVAAVASAYASHLLKSSSKKTIKVVIGHDNRHNSELFTLIASSVLLKRGIEVLTFPNNEVQPAPLVSFSIKELGLDGGIVISSSYKPKNYSGIKVYDEKGALLSAKNATLISKEIQETDFIKVKKSNAKPKNVPLSIIGKYKTKIASIMGGERANELSLTYSPQHGSATKMLPEIMRSIDVDVFVVKSQQSTDPDFKGVKSLYPGDDAAYSKAVVLAKKNKSDLIMLTDSDAGRLGVGVRYKKRYKILNGNQLAALILDHRLRNIKDAGKLSKELYMVTTNVSGNLPAKIAKKYGVEIIITQPGFKNIATTIERKGLNNFVFGFEESYGFVIDPSISMDRDALQASVAIVSLASDLKKNNFNLFSKYKELELEYGFHLDAQISKTLSNKEKSKLLSKLSKLKKIGDNKVVDIENSVNGPERILKVSFKSGSWVAASFIENEHKVKIYVETYGDGDANKLDFYPFKREVEEWVKDNTETFEDKKFSKKSFFKYSAFASISIGILVFVFLYIYKSTGSTSKDVSAFSLATWWADAPSTRWIWLTYWGWKVATLFMSAWMKKRMFQRLKEDVKTRHLVISATMGSVIAFVTPFAVGGDAIGYWYLRRKKVKRSILVATLASSTVWGESKFALQTILLVWIGWPVYKAIFDTSNPQAHAALIWFFLGLVWTFFSSGMILILTIYKRFQEFIVRNSVAFLEWIPFTHIRNIEQTEISVQYEFYLVRSSMKRIWNKWWFILEMMFYDLILMFLSPMALIYSASGMINPKAPAGTYWTQIVISDIVGTANSMSITPGGSGTGEWLGLVTRDIQYENTFLVNSSNGFTPQDIVVGGDMFYKLFIGWPFLIISTFTIFIAILTNRKKRTTGISNASLRIIMISTGSVILLTYILLIIFGVII